MAQIINRKNPAMLADEMANGYAFITLKEKGLYISKEAAALCAISSDKFIHFINDSNYWAFYINNDEDGFPISREESGGYQLWNTKIARMFGNTVGANIGWRFFVTKTKSLHNDFPIFEIITTSSIDVLIDKVKRMNEQKLLEKKYVLNLKYRFRSKKDSETLLPK